MAKQHGKQVDNNQLLGRKAQRVAKRRVSKARRRAGKAR